MPKVQDVKAKGAPLEAGAGKQDPQLQTLRHSRGGGHPPLWLGERAGGVLPWLWFLGLSSADGGSILGGLRGAAVLLIGLLLGFPAGGQAQTTITAERYNGTTWESVTSGSENVRLTRLTGSGHTISATSGQLYTAGWCLRTGVDAGTASYNTFGRPDWGFLSRQSSAQRNSLVRNSLINNDPCTDANYTNSTTTVERWLDITDDDIDEPDETIRFSFNAFRNASGSANFEYTIRDNDPTIVSLAKVGSATTITEEDSLRFTVTLGRELVAGEVIDVPLSISGMNVTTEDWSLSLVPGSILSGINTGVTLSGASTATPKLTFSGKGAQVATLEWTATAENPSQTENPETVTIALGPDGSGTNGFDRTTLGTNVGGGANPHGTNNQFSITVEDLGLNPLTWGWTGNFNTDTDAINERGYDELSIVRQYPLASVSGYTLPQSIDDTTNGNFTFSFCVRTGDDAGTATYSTDWVFTDFLPSPATRLPLIDNCNTTSLPFRVREQVRENFGAAFLITDDTIDEPDETVKITFVASDGATGTGNFEFIIEDNDPTIVSLESPYEEEDLTIKEGNVIVFQVTLGRELVAGEVVVMSLPISGTNVTTGDWNLALLNSRHGSPNTGITLSDATTATPKLTFAGAGAQTATLRWTATPDKTPESPEIVTIALGSAQEGTNVGGGANPHSNDNRFSMTVEDPSILIAETDGATSVTEAAGEGRADTYTVVAGARPSHGVEVTVESSDRAVATVSPATLSFTTGNWNTAQTVTVTAVDDHLDQGNRTVTISHASTSTDPDFHEGFINSVTATVVDDDRAGLTITHSGGSTTVTEAAGATRTDTYTVALSSEPTHGVELTLSAWGSAVAMVSPTSLSFTTSNWNTAQTVTVTGMDDNVDQGGFQRSPIVTVATTEDSKYASVFLPFVMVTVVDDDTAGVTITESGGSTAVTEAAGAGNTDTYTVVLDTKPRANVEVEVDVVAYNREVATVSPATLSFTTSNWNTAQTVTVTGVDDNVDQPGNRRLATITNRAFSSGRGGDRRYDRIPIPNTIVTVVDDDGDGVTIIESMGATLVTEASGAANTDTYTVVLNGEPGADVEIAVTSGDTGAATVSPATLTFTTSNWNIAQTVTVTGVDNTVARDTRSAAISHTATSTDIAYSGIIIDIVTATVVDDDGTGATINESNGSTSVTEASGAGNTDTYTVVLDTRPSASVEIAVASDMAAATVSPATLTFTTSNWNTAQTVTVTGVDDNTDQTGKRSATISHTATSTDANYEGVHIDDVAVAVVDDDGAGVTIIESNGSTSVTETFGLGNTDTYMVVLDSPPAGTVAIHVTSNDPSLVTASPATLTFTTTNYNTAQTVTVTGVDDKVDQESNRSTTISHSTTSTDTVYSNITITDVAVVLVDNDGRGVNVTDSDGSTSVTEATGDDNTDTYTVVLNSQPANDVTITVSSGAVTGATVNPATLTFTTSNWETAQTVTVTGVDDEVAQSSDRSVTISHSAVSNDPKYNGISISSITATVVNDDTAEVKINSTEGTGTVGIFVNEIQSQTHNPSSRFTNYLIRLATKPIAIVDIEVRSSDPEVAMIAILEEGDSPTVRRIMETLTSVTLTFTPTNWNMPQLVSLAGVDDDVDQREHRVAVITHRAISNDPNYNNISIRDALVTVLDDDRRHVRIIESDGATSVSEASGNGHTDTYVVEPTIAAGADVLISVASSDGSIATVSPTTLTFTTSNWNTAQTVTVTGVDDTTIQNSNRHTTISHTVITEDIGYRSALIRDVTVTVVDDDKLEVIIVESDGSTRVTEASGDGQSDTYTLALTSLPTAIMEITVASGDRGAATVNPATLTFTTTDGTTAQTVTVTGMDDDVDQRGHRTVTISHSASSTSPVYGRTFIRDVTTTVVDDDTAAVTINESGGVSVNEAAGAGRTDRYTVVLASLPTASVEVAVAFGNGEAATVNPATLTFNATNWSTTQTVTVTGVDDNVDQSSDRSVTISHSATSTDGNYNAIAITPVMAMVVDDDTVAVAINEFGSVSVNEATGDGRTDTYTVALATLPSASVEIAVASGDTAAVTVSPATLTFTTTNGTTPQTVTVTGVDNQGAGSNDTVAISHSASSTDSSYNTIAITDVTVTVVDDDGAGVTITESDGATVTTEEPGETSTDTYIVVLNTLPTGDVTITIASGDTAIATVDPATLTFTTTTYNTAQTVTVTGVDDNVDQGSGRTVAISHSATSTDGSYNTITITDVTVTVMDGDTAVVVVTESDNSTAVTEAAGDDNADTYTVRLASQPTASVEIVPASGDGGAATVTPATLTFTTTNYNTAQTVTVTGVDDNVAQGSNRTVAISHSASSNDAIYAVVTIDDVMVTVEGDDTVAVTITESNDVTAVTESATDTYTVSLASRPIANVNIAVASGDPAIATVNPATLTFTSNDWSTAQTVTVTGVDDNVVRGSARAVAISHSARSNDDLYDGVTINDVTATVEDDDTAAVTITESNRATVVTEPAGSNSTDTYTVRLASSPIANVSIAVTSGDLRIATVNPATLTFTVNNWIIPQTVTVTGVDDNVAQGSDRTVTISHSAVSDDLQYNAISIPDITATVVDAGSTGPAVQFSAAAYSGGEASGRRTVNVALSAAPPFTGSTSVSYYVSGTATAGDDFTIANSGTVSITGGAGTIPIAILDDQIDDDGETIVLSLTAGNGYAVGLQANTTITISDDDGTTPSPALPVVSITGIGSGVVEGNPAVFQLSATPSPPAGATISVNVSISSSGDFASSGAIGSRSVTIDDSGVALLRVSTDDDAIHEADGDITATVQEGRGYSPHGNNSSASLTVADNEVVMLSVTSLKVIEGGSASYNAALDRQPSGQVAVAITAPQGSELTLAPHRLTFTPTNWNEEQSITVTAPENFHALDRPLTLSHTATGAINPNLGLTTQLTVTVAAPQSAEYLKAWNLRLGRTLSQQVVDALQDRLSTPPAEGLQLTVAGEAIPTATPLAEQEGVLSKAMGFEAVTPQEWAEGSSFSLAQQQEGAAPQLAVWGQGAFSSFRGQEDHLSLDGSVTTLLLGGDWRTDQWQAGAALSQSWGSGSYDGDDNVAGDTSITLTGLFPYGRYALTPRLAFWAVAGYGWGTLSFQPDGGDDESTPSAAMTMAAGGIDGILLEGGSEGITLSGTADLLTVKATSASQEELDSSEGSLSRLRLGIEATRLFPLAQGASLLPSMTLGIRQDSGDAESGFGVDWGAGMVWRDPERGISGALQGHILLAHAEENFEEQGLAFSFSWAPNPANRGPSLSLHHIMGAAPSGSMDALLHPATMEGLEATPSNGQQFEAELAYGFPAHNDHITLTPALALALSPTSNTYTLLWSVAPYSEQAYPAPWALSLAGERQEQNTSTSPVDHSLELRFSTLF